MEGGCACNALRYRLTSAPMFVHCCHCRDCQRQTGTAFVDDPSALPPDVHIFVRSKHPWITLPASVPAFEVYYDAKTLWPEASLERRRAMFG